MLVVLAIVGALVLGTVVFLRVAGGGRFPWIAFYTKGKEAGFTFREIGLLRRVAVESKTDNPTTLFWSLKQLDKSIRDIIIKLRAGDREDNEEGNNLLSKLFELRKRLEFDLPKYKLGIKSSKNIMVRQRVKLTLPGVGPFASIVVENLPKYMALSYPQGQNLPEGFSWKGQTVGVYFWRTEDAGYYFQSKVIDDYSEKQYPIIHVGHSDGLVRTQKRTSVRIATDLAAELFPLKSIEAASEMQEQAKGLRCRLMDLSEGGAALLIGGRAKAGLPVKLQVELGGRVVVMPGVVKSASFDGKSNRSVLHLQAVPLSSPSRNRVLTYVYNLLGDRNGTKPQKGKPPQAAPTQQRSALR
jgi:c-di-GMP-binding flagellar brake protein YcgR